MSQICVFGEPNIDPELQDQEACSNVAKASTLHSLCDNCLSITRRSKILPWATEVIGELLEELYNHPQDDHVQELEREDFEFRFPITKVEELARRGCHLCRLLWSALTDSERRKLEADNPDSYVISIRCRFLSGKGTWKTGRGVFINVYIDTVMDVAGRYPDLPLEVYKAFGTTSRMSYYNAIWFGDHDGTKPPESTDSDAHFSRVQSWINSCLKNHISCRQHRRHVVCPSRLIDVDMPEGVGQVRIVEPDATMISRRIAYLTLSHVWGDPTDILKLTRDNIEEFRQGIYVLRLPMTFRDAILITRKLGYRYIWIDSLCIIQDSPDDFKKESVTMADVYGNSVCTIAVLGPGSRGSCFKTRQPCWIPCRLLPNIRIARNLLPSRNERYPEPDPRSPLLRRAWVYQERVLSPRIIYYGASELFWECCELTATDSLPAGRVTAKARHSKYLFHSMMRAPSTANGRNLSQAEFKDNWYMMVEQYSRGALTFPTDRPVAISGIVQILQENTCLPYRWGMWLENSCTSLLWRYSPDQEPIQAWPVRQDTSPSWSWLSINSPVKFNIGNPHIPIDWGDPKIAFTAKILDMPTNHSDHCLMLRAVLKPLPLSQTPTPSDYCKWSLPLNEQTDLKLTIYRDTPFAADSNLMLCMLESMIFSHRLWPEKHVDMGLVLRPNSQGQPPVYTRVGCFVLEWSAKVMVDFVFVHTQPYLSVNSVEDDIVII